MDEKRSSPPQTILCKCKEDINKNNELNGVVKNMTSIYGAFVIGENPWDFFSGSEKILNCLENNTINGHFGIENVALFTFDTGQLRRLFEPPPQDGEQSNRVYELKNFPDVLEFEGGEMSFMDLLGFISSSMNDYVASISSKFPETESYYDYNREHCYRINPVTLFSKKEVYQVILENIKTE